MSNCCQVCGDKEVVFEAANGAWYCNEHKGEVQSEETISDLEERVEQLEDEVSSLADRLADIEKVLPSKLGPPIPESSGS